MTMLREIPGVVKPESFASELLAAVRPAYTARELADLASPVYPEPTAEDHQWAARHLNRDWHAAEPSPFELSLWSPEVPADVWEAEAEYRELARLAAEAEEADRVEAGYACL